MGGKRIGEEWIVFRGWKQTKDYIPRTSLQVLYRGSVLMASVQGEACP